LCGSVSVLNPNEININCAKLPLFILGENGLIFNVGKGVAHLKDST
jgi:hypothetical protein